MATSLSSLTSTGLSTNSNGSSSSGSGAFVGLGQGINVNSFVQAAESDALAEITNVQNEQTSNSAQSSALAAITANLTALQSDVSALNDPLGVLSSQLATSSNSNEITASATSGATAGVHTINVTSLATTSSYYSDPVATGSTPLATEDTITISEGANQLASVTLNSSNNTLDDIAAAINAQTTGVQASVINDANGARLAIVSSTSGAPGNLTVTGTLHNTNNTAINLNQAVAGVNAVLTVDNVPVSSATNSVSGVISGVTLNLQAPTNGTPVTLTVAPDTSSITSAINQFVTDYNTAITSINAQFAVNSDGSGVQPLEADSTLADAQSQLLGAISYSTTGSNGPVSLATLGISTNDDGTLSVDSGALAAALSSNYAGVQSFFQTVSTGFAANLGTVLNNVAGPGGELAVDANGYTSTATDLSQQLSDLQAALAVQTTNLTATYAQVNDTLEELPLLQAQLGQQLATIA